MMLNKMIWNIKKTTPKCSSSHSYYKKVASSLSSSSSSLMMVLDNGGRSYRHFSNMNNSKDNYRIEHFDDEFDYVVLGAGSAGCVLTNRLTEDPNVKVALVEAGGSDRGRIDSWTIQMPAALTYSVADDRNNWDFRTIPQKHLNNRNIHQPRGRVLGGSSSINAMVYARGHSLDFNRWNDKDGAEGWSYADVLPYFKKAQKHSKGENEYRGDSGPLHVRNYDERKGEVTNELFKVLCDAGEEAGYPRSHDFNGYCQEGFGPFDMTIDPKGVRCSASAAYLHPALKERKSQIDLRQKTIVNRIIFDRDASGGEPRAIGVEVMDKKTGAIKKLRAKNEVILSLGSIGSPQTLMLSGIGDTVHLREAGVLQGSEKALIENDQVGANLQDHLEVYLQYRCTKPVTLYPVGNWSLRHFHTRAKVGIEWFLRGTGVCASNQFETGAFIRSHKGIEHPDIQYHFIPGCVVGQLDFLPEHGFQIHVGTLRPTSRGTLKLKDSNPLSAPLIDPNYLDTEQDRVDMRRAVRLADEIIQQKAFDEYRGTRLNPGPEYEINNDESVDNWIREYSHSAYHPSCTNGIGKVVDSHGKVFGAQGLRIVDASIMPTMTSGNLNAPTIMMAEKIADSIKGKPFLDPIDAKFYIPDDWELYQRPKNGAGVGAINEPSQ